MLGICKISANKLSSILFTYFSQAEHLGRWRQQATNLQTNERKLQNSLHVWKDCFSLGLLLSERKKA